jgi:tRNA threonylcarbamoyladenosine biosynthesis protein TsaE
MKKRISTKSRRETQLAGAAFGVFLQKLSHSASHAQVVALKGELGAGKTTFVQGVAKGLGVKERVLSPTFVIIKFYKLPAFAKASAGKQNSKFFALHHIDCYRIKNERDLLVLGWDKIVSDPKNIILIEWPERVRKILPKDTISISFKTIKTSKSPARKITFS